MVLTTCCSLLWISTTAVCFLWFFLTIFNFLVIIIIGHERQLVIIDYVRNIWGDIKVSITLRFIVLLITEVLFIGIIVFFLSFRFSFSLERLDWDPEIVKILL